MATVKFVLHRAYKQKTTSDKVKDHSPAESVSKRTKGGKTSKRILIDRPVRLYAVLIVRRGEVIKIKTKHAILPAEWDFSRQLLNDRIAGSPEFNSELHQLRKDILAKYNQTVKEHPDMAFQGIQQIMTDFGKVKEIPYLEHGKDLFSFLDEFIEYHKGETTYRTAQKFMSLKNALQEFGAMQKYRKYQNLSFSMIDARFKDAFIKYLRERKPSGRMKTRPDDFQTGLLVDTEAKYIECIKSFCAWSEERGYNKYTDYKRFKNYSDANRKRAKPKNEIITLTLHELNQLYKHDFSDRPTLERVRDLFCFGAYTGQRWSDIEAFDKRDLTGDVWSFTSYKTKKKMKIDLVGYMSPALDILKKYNYELPKISLVKFNLNIKTAAGVAGIKEPVRIKRYVGSKEIEIEKLKFKFLSSHSARKTCLSLLLNEFNVPVTHVLQISGHSDLKTLMVYVDKDEKSRRDFMSKTTPVTEVDTLKVAK